MTQHTATARPTALVDSRPGWRVWNLAAVAALTAYSTGVAWQAQFVSYPLYRALSAEEFGAFHLAYNAAIPAVVIVPGFASFLACAALPLTRPEGVSRTVAALVATGGVGSLLSTVLWAIPMHDRLDAIGQDRATIDSLLQANAVRTALLTLATGALTWSIATLIGRVQARSSVARTTD